MNKKLNERLSQITATIAGVLGIGGLGALTITESSYFKYSAYRHADPSSGRTIPHGMKGMLVYITHADKTLLSVIYGMLIASWILIAVGSIVWSGKFITAKEQRHVETELAHKANGNPRTQMIWRIVYIMEASLLFGFWIWRTISQERVMH